MSVRDKHWQKLFLFCLGLFIASGFCLKWMETDFWVNNSSFTILGLELFYSKEKVMAILSGLDGHVKTILSYHLHFDFVFMAGVFPGIAALCMMAREKLNATVSRKLLFILASLQLLAWVCDITENLYLIRWLDEPVIGNEFGFFHGLVITKFAIALTGVLVGTGVMLFKWRKRPRYSM